MTTYYDIPIELIRIIHGLCGPEGYGEFRIADARLVDHDRFEDYKLSQLVTIVTEVHGEHGEIYKQVYTTFRGKCHGQYKFWHVDKEELLLQSTFYVHGKRHGEHKEWLDIIDLTSSDKDCERISHPHIHEIYVHGKRHGEYKE
jgi:hypothetical protein